MTSKREKERAALRQFQKLEDTARARYVYFIDISDDPAEPGYRWQLVGPDDTVICESLWHIYKADCLKSLRATQRHAADAPVRDDDR